jgi:Na+-translocating ferredoxin:NAD+ oxidoreductase subunit G
MKQPTSLSTVLTFAATMLFFIILLAGVNAWTSPRIAAYEQARAKRTALQAQAGASLQPLFPEATGFEKLGSTTFHDSIADYFRVSKGPATIGYAIHAFGAGYQSIIHAIVGVNPDFTIRSVRVIGQAETEGLGTRLLETDFLKQFSGKKADRLHVIKEGDSADAITAITAATISSRALTEDGVKSAVVFLKNQMGK